MAVVEGQQRPAPPWIAGRAGFFISLNKRFPHQVVVKHFAMRARAGHVPYPKYVTNCASWIAWRTKTGNSRVFAFRTAEELASFVATWQLNELDGREHNLHPGPTEETVQ